MKIIKILNIIESVREIYFLNKLWGRPLLYYRLDGLDHSSGLRQVDMEIIAREMEVIAGDTEITAGDEGIITEVRVSLPKP